MLNKILSALKVVEQNYTNISNIVKSPIGKWVLGNTVLNKVYIDRDCINNEVSRQLEEEITKLIVFRITKEEAFEFNRRRPGVFGSKLNGHVVIKHDGKYFIASVRRRGNVLDDITITSLSPNKQSLTNLLNTLLPPVFNMPYIINPDGSSTRISERYVSDENYLPTGIYQQVDEIVNRLVNDPDYYKRHNLPRKETIMLYGPPGTGKTSLARHMAVKYNSDLVLNNRTSANRDDSPLMVLFEDVDRNPAWLNTQLNDSPIPSDVPDGVLNANSFPAFNSRSPFARIASEFTEILNYLDGPTPLENILVIVTANNPELLNPALTREGRIDTAIEIGYLTKEEFVAHVGFPEDDERIVHFFNNYSGRSLNAGLVNIIKHCSTIEMMDKRMRQQIVRDSEMQY